MRKLTLLMGPPASGKTTFAEELRAIYPLWVFVSPDLVWHRHTKTGRRYWVDDNGKYVDWETKPIDPDTLRAVRKLEMGRLIRLMEVQQALIYEDSLVTKATREPIITVATALGYKIDGKFFYPSLWECAQRNAARKDSVPDVVLARLYADVEVPVKNEGFDTLEIIK